MNKKKNILTGFAIFAAMLMLTVSSIAAPVQQKAIMNTSEPKITNDTTTKSTCSLCAQDISAELSAAITELETMQKKGLIPPELSEEAAQIMMIVGITDWPFSLCLRIGFILQITYEVFCKLLNGDVSPEDMPQWWQDLADAWLENCDEFIPSQSQSSPGNPTTR